MQEQQPEPGRRPAQQFAGVDLRRPRGYVAVPAPQPSAAAAAAAAGAAVAGEGDPCPRCESRDTKFCYYNNYNTSQPRHFCKGCRRYWTKGGTLRNVPVGGGTRKKSASSSSSSSSSSAPYAKRQKPSKKLRVAPPQPATAAKTTEATATTTITTPPPADAASEITTELVVPAAEDDSLTDLLQPDVAPAAVELGLGFSDYPACSKGLSDLDLHFDWPPAFDTGACWTPSSAFADTDPAAVFLNLP
ncbi:hypothetical protein GUJ93_ZPchr0010g7937 [Zizania palustris]|uniref:Dof zinc finger protein n=1 Tax=Zizania palustris TaxID=103762 RepID=A0A8J6BL86_ZIZPA|nr:hypothetical protein GUJ93_ZPchr0010g7937 [Zizania palustris]